MQKNVNILIFGLTALGTVLLIKKLLSMEFKSKYFTLDEFQSKDGSKMPEKVKKYIQELAKNLDVIRETVGVPITINSGYRSPQHNANVGGVKNSFHTKGMAVDIVAHGYTTTQLKKIIEALITEGKIKQGGIGFYPSWIHYDIRGNIARWNG